MIRTLKDLNVKGKRVLLRTDYNVPLDGNTILDDKRIQGSLKTIRYLLDQECRIIILTSLGRPKGRFNEAFKLDPVAQRLSELLQKPVKKLDDCIHVGQQLETIESEEIVMLENLRFYPGEEANDDEFARQLAEYGQVYVNDAFANSHRAHASMEAITKHLPSCAGFLVEKEVEMLSKALDPEKPFVVILGGAKVSDKILLIDSFVEKADKILIGGAMMFTFIKAEGFETGKSLVETDRLGLAKELLAHKCLIIPDDCICGKELKDDTEISVRKNYEIMKDEMGLDIGPETIDNYKHHLSTAKTVFWNGPLGAFEMPNFAKGTNEIAGFLAELTDKGITTIIGGGDSGEAINKLGLADRMTHVSTGGGASIEYLEKGTLPALKVLEK